MGETRRTFSREFKMEAVRGFQERALVPPTRRLILPLTQSAFRYLGCDPVLSRFSADRRLG